MANLSNPNGSFGQSNSAKYRGMSPVDVSATDCVLDRPAQGLYITGAGNVVIVCPDGSGGTVAVPANFVLPVAVSQITKTSTTATGIWVLW